MNSCYLYAIVQTPERTTPLLGQAGPGLRERPLQFVVHNKLAAVISDWPPTALNKLRTPTEGELWRHEQVIEGLMTQLPTLPVRYGTTLADEAQVQQLLAKREADFVADLALVAGRVEMGLRVLWDPPANPSVVTEAHPSSGRHYLQQQLQKHKAEEALRARGQAFGQALNFALQPLVIQWQARVLLTERLLLSAAYLVERKLVDAFQTQVALLEQTYPDLAFLTTGPWPAYHFVRNPQQTGNL